MKAVGKKLLVLCIALVAVVTLVACENPLDPLDKSVTIRGLAFVDFALTFDKWDSDPENDGVIITLEYFNEFGDSLSFHDKPHRVVIEFYRQQQVEVVLDEDDKVIEEGRPTFEELLFTYPVVHSHSDDEIRIPIEAYIDILEFEQFDLTEDVEVFVVVNVFPPQAEPKEQLVALQPDQAIFKPEESAATEEDIVSGSPDDDGDGWTIASGDCNDADPLINPDASEVCGNGIDDDCNGGVDDGCP